MYFQDTMAKYAYYKRKNCENNGEKKSDPSKPSRTNNNPFLSIPGIQEEHSEL